MRRVKVLAVLVLVLSPAIAGAAPALLGDAAAAAPALEGGRLTGTFTQNGAVLQLELERTTNPP